MRKTRRGVGIFLITACLVGCAGIQTSQDYDAATDFSVLKTYSWADTVQAETGDPRIDNPLQDARIRSAVEQVLAVRGFFKMNASAGPSFQVRYVHTLRPRMDSGGSGIDFGIGLGGFRRRTAGGIALGTGNSVDTYDEGELVIDIIRNQPLQLLWRGTGTYRFTEYQNPAEADVATERLINTIMAPFPPKKPG